MTETDIGGRVRLAREQRGLTLVDAARVTKLPTRVIGAIERNEFASLPAGIYRKAYLRTLAAEVGLDPYEIAADYETQYAKPARPAPTADAMRTPRRTLVTVIVVALFVVVWFALQLDGESVSSSSVVQRGLSERGAK